jgi:hypothetical protein
MNPSLRATPLLLALLPACVNVKLLPEAKLVRVTSNVEAVTECSLLGEVKGADHFNGGIIGQGAAEENAYRMLKNNAAKMGANTVLVSTGSVGMSGARQRGEAYKCVTTPPSK